MNNREDWDDEEEFDLDAIQARQDALEEKLARQDALEEEQTRRDAIEEELARQEIQETELPEQETGLPEQERPAEEPMHQEVPAMELPKQKRPAEEPMHQEVPAMELPKQKRPAEESVHHEVTGTETAGQERPTEEPAYQDTPETSDAGKTEKAAAEQPEACVHDPETDWEAVVEAVLFTMGSPVELGQLAAAIGQDADMARKVVENLAWRYDHENRGMQVIRLEDSYQLCTRGRFYENLIRVASAPRRQVLTDVALETLSIIAYKQPVTRAEIEKIRGVNSDHAVSRLVEYGLVEEIGRLDAPGRPSLFATTEEFLRRFGIGSTENLPDMDPVRAEEIRSEVEEELQVDLKEMGQQETEETAGTEPNAAKPAAGLEPNAAKPASGTESNAAKPAAGLESNAAESASRPEPDTAEPPAGRGPNTAEEAVGPKPNAAEPAVRTEPGASGSVSATEE